MTIKELRERNNLSQREFANILGVTQTAVYKWELKDTKINKVYQEKLEENFCFKSNSSRITSFDLGV